MYFPLLALRGNMSLILPHKPASVVGCKQYMEDGHWSWDQWTGDCISMLVGYP